MGRSLETVVDSLAHRIRGAACNVARSYQYDAVEDIEQEITLAIMERYVDDPDWIDNGPAYVVNYGAWRAQNWLRHQLWGGIVEDEVLESGETLLEQAPAPSENPIQTIWITTALDSLDEQTRQIANAFAAGYTVREIAQRIGVSRQTVCNRKLNIAVALGGAL